MILAQLENSSQLQLLQEQLKHLLTMTIMMMKEMNSKILNL